MLSEPKLSDREREVLKKVSLPFSTTMLTDQMTLQALERKGLVRMKWELTERGRSSLRTSR